MNYKTWVKIFKSSDEKELSRDLSNFTRTNEAVSIEYVPTVLTDEQGKSYIEHCVLVWYK